MPIGSLMSQVVSKYHTVTKLNHQPWVLSSWTNIDTMYSQFHIPIYRQFYYAGHTESLQKLYGHCVCEMSNYFKSIFNAQGKSWIKLINYFLISRHSPRSEVGDNHPQFLFPSTRLQVILKHLHLFQDEFHF